MRIGICSAVLVSTLAACAPDGLADQLARDQARRAVNPVLAQRFPGIPLEPAANCVIEAASAAELLQLARAGTVAAGGTLAPGDTELIIDIATRTDTIGCLLNEGVGPFLTRKSVAAG